MNRLILDPNGLVGPSVGAVATALSYASNKPVTSFGKPSKEYFKRAFELLGINQPERVYMVSDDPFTDLAEGKKVAGFKTVFVLSGKYRDASVLDSVEPQFRPDYVFEDISGCLKLLEGLKE
jgi:4-nitrophenyl phosphatase